MTIRAPLAITNFANFSPINFSPNFGPVLARKPSPRGHAQKPTSQYRRPHGHTTVNELLLRVASYPAAASASSPASPSAAPPLPSPPYRSATAAARLPPRPLVGAAKCCNSSFAAKRLSRRFKTLVPPPSSSGVRPSVPPPASPRSQQLTPLRLVELCG